MKKLLLTLLLIISGILAFEPFGIGMPTNAQMAAATALLAVLIVSIGLLWQEKPADEREEQLFNQRGKLAYFIGLSIGSLGIIFNVFNHTIDWWLIAAVGSMLSVKLFRNK